MVLLEKFFSCSRLWFRLSRSLNLRHRKPWKLFNKILNPRLPSLSSSYYTQTITSILPHPNPLHRSSFAPSIAIISNNRDINRYLRSGLLSHALYVFDEMPERDVVSWNSVIAYYARVGSPQQAMGLLRDMLASGINENPHTFPPILTSCSHEQGRQLHCRVISIGFASNLFIGTALINLYMRGGSPDVALKVFDGLPHRSTAACNSVLRGYCDLCLTDELLSFFVLDLRSELGVNLDDLSYSYLMRACCSDRRLEEGKQLHCYVAKSGWVPANLFLSNAVVDLYSATGELIDARRAIDCIPPEDVISWNSMVSVCADNGSLIEAMWFFHRMLCHGKNPSVRSFVGLLNLSSRTCNIALGVRVHGFVLKRGFGFSSIYVQSALIDMYGKCFDIDSSVMFFNEIPERGLECCNSLITAFLHCNLSVDAIEMFGLMIDEGQRPDHVSISAALKALLSSSSARSVSLAGCQMLHCCAVKLGLESNEAVSCSLMDTYARSGHWNLSRQVFKGMENPNLICFTAAIAACARIGMAGESLQLLDEMLQRGMKPDSITLLCIMAGCDHSGMVEEARLVLESMRTVHRVEPDRRHYSCMVSLLGRAGLVEEAMEMARSHCDPRMWSSLLHNCRVHGNEEIGRMTAEVLMELHPRTATVCLEVMKFYYEIGDAESLARVREMLQDCPGKETGCSVVEVQSITHL